MDLSPTCRSSFNRACAAVRYWCTHRSAWTALNRRLSCLCSSKNSLSLDSREESHALLWKMMLNLFPLKGVGEHWWFLLLSGKFRIGEASLTSHTHNPVRTCTLSALNVQFHIHSLHALYTLPLRPLYLHQRSFSPMHELSYLHHLLTGWDNEVHKRNFSCWQTVPSHYLSYLSIPGRYWRIQEKKNNKQDLISLNKMPPEWYFIHVCVPCNG